MRIINKIYTLHCEQDTIIGRNNIRGHLVSGESIELYVDTCNILHVTVNGKIVWQAQIILPGLLMNVLKDHVTNLPIITVKAALRLIGIPYDHINFQPTKPSWRYRCIDENTE